LYINGGWDSINEITLFTNGAPHEQSINIDSILHGVAIQPGVTWTIQNTNVAILSGSGEHPTWQYFNRTGWVRTVDANSDLYLRSSPHGGEVYNNRIGANDNGVRVECSSS